MEEAMTLRTTLMTMLLSACSTAALAGGYPGFEWVTPATATRSQVLEEFARARASGELRSFESMTGPRTTSNRTRVASARTTAPSLHPSYVTHVIERQQQGLRLAGLPEHSPAVKAALR
jgi:hypothetical protein